jgi:MoaA/NifB/PqqE/SkfB family radical SAM enzyme
MAAEAAHLNSKDVPTSLYQYEEIGNVHLELTHRCNAACPMCARNLSGGITNPNLPLVELSLSDIERIFTPSFIRKLEQIYACGNYGDPIIARDCLPIFQYFRERNPDLYLGLHTNGSARRPSWWQKLAEILKDGPHYVRFGLDGLEDTNHIYRRGTNWKVIMRNVQAFIDAGGRAEWDYLVFRHNEHQVEAARELAGEMGFAKFYVRKTGRFLKPGQLQTSDRFDVRNRAGEVEYWLELPRNEEYLNPAYDDLTPVAEKYGDYDSYLDQSSIQCKAAMGKQKLYISAQGLALPCCWLGEVFSEIHNPARRQFVDLVNANGGKQMLDTNRHDRETIVNGPLFQRQIPESWQLESIASGKLAICARNCGLEYDALGKQRS